MVVGILDSLANAEWTRWWLLTHQAIVHLGGIHYRMDVDKGFVIACKVSARAIG